MKAIIAYYSRAGGNYVGGTIRDIKTGHTEIAAGLLQKLTGADMFKIEQEAAYSKDYNECIEEAKQDQKRGARPSIISCPEDLDGYDTVYLGYPNYWGSMPMAVFTFLEKYDLTGKKIKPFCTHEGSGMGVSERDIKKLCPGAEVAKGLAVIGGKAAESEPLFVKWLKA